MQVHWCGKTGTVPSPIPLSSCCWHSKQKLELMLALVITQLHLSMHMPACVWVLASPLQIHTEMQPLWHFWLLPQVCCISFLRSWSSARPLTLHLELENWSNLSQLTANTLPKGIVDSNTTCRERVMTSWKPRILGVIVEVRSLQINCAIYSSPK